MSTEKNLLQNGFQSLVESELSIIFYLSVYAQRFIDKDRQYPLG